MKKLIKPCGHKVLVRPDKIENEHQVEGTDIKIALVHQNERVHQAAQITGVVVDVGPNAWEAFRTVDNEGKWVNGAPWAKPGDHVYFSKYTGHQISPNEDDEVLVLLNDEDINAIVYEVEEGE